MSLDEVGKNEFYIACLYLVKDIIRDVEKREGFNMDRNNYHLLTDDEIFILGLYNILNSIENCLFSIENASIFMKHFFGKNYFEKYQISSVDYYQYHYDVFCFKISTLKDLYYKLINYLYGLKLKGKNCNWCEIEKKKDEINNPFLFYLITENYNRLSIIYNSRNDSAHEGKIGHKAFNDIAPYVMIDIYAKNKIIENNYVIKRGSFWEYKYKNSRKQFLEEVDICKHNAFLFTRCILCSLSDKFAQSISSDIKYKYSETCGKIIQEIQKNKCSINQRIWTEWEYCSNTDSNTQEKQY